MTKPFDPPASSGEDTSATPARTPEQTAKADRLAKALRDNLRRRKAVRTPPSKPDLDTEAT